MEQRNSALFMSHIHTLRHTHTHLSPSLSSHTVQKLMSVFGVLWGSSQRFLDKQVKTVKQFTDRS